MADEAVYAIASGKGGVGKTTTTVNLGTALAGAGHTVAVVDADLGMANLAGFVSLSPDSTTLHQVLAGEASVEEATYELTDNIVAVPSGSDLESYASADATELGTVVDRLRKRFDYVLLDVGAGVSHETVLPLGLADGVVLVTTPDPAAVRDAEKTIDLTDRADGRVLGLVITRTRDNRDIDFEGIASKLDVPLIGTVPEDEAVHEAIYSGTPVVVDAPESPAAVAYRRLAERILGRGDRDAATESDAASGDASAADSGDADGSAADEDDASTTDVSSAIDGVDESEGDTGNATPDADATEAADAASSSVETDASAGTDSPAETDASAESEASVDGDESAPTEQTVDATEGADADVVAESTDDGATEPAGDAATESADDAAAASAEEAPSPPDEGPTDDGATAEREDAETATAEADATTEVDEEDDGVTIPDAESDAGSEDESDGVTFAEDDEADEDIDEDAIPFSDREPPKQSAEDDDEEDEDEDGGFFGRLLG